MKPDKFDRNSAFSMSIQDPDDLNEKSAISEMLTIDNEFLIITSSAIYRGLTADTIDPQKQYPETRNSYEKLYSIGTNNSYVARMILQFKEILGLAIQDAALRERLLSHVWQANKLLLNCESAHYYIYKEAMALMPRCNEIIELNKTKNAIPAIPKIADLEKHVEYFLNNGKLFLGASYELLHIFYTMPFQERKRTHFDCHRKWIADKLGTDNAIYLLLDQDKVWVSMISAARNAIPHPESGQRVEIENFSIKPGNKFSSPAWRYDLTKKGIGKQVEFSDLISDFAVYLTKFLEFFEALLILCIKDRLGTSSWLDIYRKRNEDISLECPILYFVARK